MEAVAQKVEQELVLTEEQEQAAEEDHLALQMRLGGLLSGALTSNLIELGDRLGLYAGLKKHGPCSAADLAGALGLSERYVLEWCRQQVRGWPRRPDDVPQAPYPGCSCLQLPSHQNSNVGDVPNPSSLLRSDHRLLQRSSPPTRLPTSFG